MENIKLGFVPAHREPFDEEWAAQIRKRCLNVLSRVPQLEIIVPDEKLTRNGCVWDDTDAEKTIRLFQERGIDGLIIGTMTFGDEVAALSIASAFPGLPVLLFGTKEGDFTPQGGRRSDSLCGTLSISSGLHRRKIPFTFAGVLFPEEEIFLESILDFVRICSVIRGFVAARIGIVGPRPERFETCIFSEDAMMRQFRQRVVPTSIPDIMNRANSFDNNTPELQKIHQEMRQEADLSELTEKTIMTIAGLEYALLQFAEEKGLSAMGIQCFTPVLKPEEIILVHYLQGKRQGIRANVIYTGSQAC